MTERDVAATRAAIEAEERELQEQRTEAVRAKAMESELRAQRRKLDELLDRRAELSAQVATARASSEAACDAHSKARAELQERIAESQDTDATEAACDELQRELAPFQDPGDRAVRAARAAASCRQTLAGRARRQS